MLVRERSRSDRRIVRLQLTQKGRQKVAELLPLAVGRLNESLAQFDRAEFTEFARLLKKFSTNLQQGLAADGSRKTLVRKASHR